MSKLKFTKYQSIKRGTDIQTLNYYIQQGYDKVRCYVTEKIHGTNGSFITNGIEIKFAQRTCISTGIFNSQADAHKVESKIIQLANHLGTEIQVYFEYFGADIAGKSTIPYFKDKTRKEFIGLDIFDITNDTYISYPQNFQLFDMFEIPHVPVLFEGTLSECLLFDKSFNSLVAENVTKAEGFVIKPFENITMADGQRVLLKMVAPEFDDIKKTGKDLEIAKQKQVNFDIFNRTNNLIDECLNSVRCDKVAAKFGIESINKKKFSVLLKELANDIADESDFASIDLAAISQATRQSVEQIEQAPKPEEESQQPSLQTDTQHDDGM